MKVAVPVEDQYQVLEVWYPYLRLKEERIKTVFVGTGKSSYRSKDGCPVKEGVSIKEIKPDEFYGIIIPGGYAPDILRRSREICDFVRNIFYRIILSPQYAMVAGCLYQVVFLKVKK